MRNVFDTPSPYIYIRTVYREILFWKLYHPGKNEFTITTAFLFVLFHTRFRPRIFCEPLRGNSLIARPYKFFPQPSFVQQFLGKKYDTDVRFNFKVPRRPVYQLNSIHAHSSQFHRIFYRFSLSFYPPLSYSGTVSRISDTRVWKSVSRGCRERVGGGVPRYFI